MFPNYKQLKQKSFDISNKAGYDIQYDPHTEQHIEWPRQEKEQAQKLAEALDRLKTSPGYRALKKLKEGFATLRDDPDIASHKGCLELLEVLQELVQMAYLDSDVDEIVRPLATHFNVEKSRRASEAKKALKDAQRAAIDQFLDEQRDIADTTRLAGRLRKTFTMKSDRAAKDEVRRWKKLRATGRA